MKPETAATPVPPESAQADVLGEAAVLAPPVAPVPLGSTTGGIEQDGHEASTPEPAEDENQAAFTASRNLPNRNP